MSKSSGNFITLQTSLPPERGFSLKDKGFAPLDYRFFLLGGHYRKQLVFSLDALESAKNGRAALYSRVAKLITRANTEEGLGLTVENFASVLGDLDCETENLAKFREGLENDLATPVAMAAVQKEAAGKGTTKASISLAAILKMDSVLSLDIIKGGFETLAEAPASDASKADSHEGDPEAAEIDALVAERTAAKKAKDFAKADEIRNQLTARGVIIIDTPNGPTWKRG
ncbi:MAG: cysteine--tRNA ligase, partial [Treponema sp.]|nr:cysteine--tRNA ligase [Treponema sp.]